MVRVPRRQDPRHRRRSRRPPTKLIPGPSLRPAAAAVRDRTTTRRTTTRTCRSSISRRRRSSQVTERGHRDRRRRAASSTSSCGRPGSTSAPARSTGWASAAATASPSRSTGPTVRARTSASRAAGFPNFFFPGGPHGSTGNNPRYAGDQVDFVMDVLRPHARRTATTSSRSSAAAEEYWSGMVNTYASTAPFSEASYFFGANIPGKPHPLPAQPGWPSEAPFERSPGRSTTGSTRSRSSGPRIG